MIKPINLLQAVVKTLENRCYEQGGGCYNCCLRPVHDSGRCLLTIIKVISEGD